MPFLQNVGEPIDGQVSGGGAAPGNEMAAQVGVRGEAGDGCRQAPLVARRESEAVLAVAEELGGPAPTGGYDRGVTRHGLYRHETERLVPGAGEQEHIRSAVTVGQGRAGHEVVGDAVSQAQPARDPVETGAHGGVAPTDDVESGLSGEKVEGPHRRLDSLPSIESAHVEEPPPPRSVWGPSGRRREVAGVHA